MDDNRNNEKNENDDGCLVCTTLFQRRLLRHSTHPQLRKMKVELRNELGMRGISKLGTKCLWLNV